MKNDSSRQSSRTQPDCKLLPELEVRGRQLDALILNVRNINRDVQRVRALRPLDGREARHVSDSSR